MHVLVFDIGGTHVRALVADAAGAVVARADMATERFLAGDPLSLLADMARDTARDLPAGLDGIVVGIPGILDATRRGILETPLVPTLRIEHFADALEARCGVPVILDHDATLQTRGEALRGAGAGYGRVLGIYFGTGVGAAFLDAGALPGGPYRMQLGHVPLRGEGRIGTGGAVDCVEAYASGLVLRDLAAGHGVAIAEAFTSDDARLRDALRTFLADQALSIAMAMSFVDPEVVVVGGGVVEMAGYPFDALAALVDDRLSPVIGKGRRPVRRARLGADAALWGAIDLIRSRRPA
ncbi:sugar kinase [Aureimonas endophytica]|uniref:Sugar kinase n=1 Tax=Aureimonas endophytica TaxID=2027858 RepID=A0A916ZSV8_9HYPH|nr:ROK family protein [Aureimonas endophytica]GGE11494.1 sugar kinase [Aureimonas endophytica]